jgi:hypothetical protein
MEAVTVHRLLAETAKCLETLGITIGIKEIALKEQQYLPALVEVELTPFAFRAAFAGQTVKIIDSMGYSHLSFKVGDVRFATMERTAATDSKQITLPRADAVA